MQYVFAAGKCVAVWGIVRFWRDLDLEGGMTVSADGDAWQHVEGVDGEIARVRRSNFPGTVTLNVSQHSAANRDLLARLTFDATTGLGIAPFLVQDAHSGIGFSSPIAYLMGLPDHSYSGSTHVAVWRLKCPMLVPIPGPGLSTGLGLSTVLPL